MSAEIKKFSITIFMNEKAIPEHVPKLIGNEVRNSLLKVLDGKEIGVEFTYTIQPPEIPAPPPVEGAIDLIRIYFFDGSYSTEILEKMLSSRGVLPNVVYVLHYSIPAVNKKDLIRIASLSSSQYFDIPDFSDSYFYVEFIELMHGLTTTHRALLVETEEENEITQQELKDAADQLDFAIDAIEEMRLNNTFDIVAGLRDVSAKIRNKTISTDAATRSDIKAIADEVVNIATKLMDVMENKKFAGIAVSGIVASVVGYIGFPAVTAMGLCMAYAQGPDMFRKYIEQINVRTGTTGRSKPVPAPAPTKKPRASRIKNAD